MKFSIFVCAQPTRTRAIFYKMFGVLCKVMGCKPKVTGSIPGSGTFLTCQVTGSIPGSDIFLSS
jgi:hypothetical protein